MNIFARFYYIFGGLQISLLRNHDELYRLSIWKIICKIFVYKII